MPLHVGGCAVFAFHGVHDAPRLHARFKECHLDAAVLDHALLVSPLQLAVAWQRAAQSALFDADSDRHRHAREPIARGLFLALSVSNQLHRALQVLTAGPATTAVVVLVRESDLDAAKRQLIYESARSCGAVEHEIDPTVPGCVHLSASTEAAAPAVATTESGAHSGGRSTSPAPRATITRFVEPRQVMAYYQISDADVRAARQSLNRADEVLLRRQCLEAGVDVPTHGTAWEEVLNVKSLEICVVQKLALYDC